MSSLDPYHLRENPFSATPLLDPDSQDDRVNGRIYNPSIRETETRSFESKVRQRPPLIYIENSVFQRGVGKSALLVQQWRQLQQQPNVTSIYVRSIERLRPVDFAAHLIERWHQQGHLWKVLLRTLEVYVTSGHRSEMPLAGFRLFKEKLADLPLRPVSLANFNVFNPKQLISALATQMQREAGDQLHADLARVFYQSYLTDPASFLDLYPAVLRRQRSDHIAMLAGVYRLLKLGGYQYHYLFFDQFEEVVQGMTGKALITFNSETRRLVEASLGHATITVTLHPGATQALQTHEGGDIRSIAPLDPRHVVDVRPLTQEGAHQLARTYLDYYRVPDAQVPSPLHPFTPEAIDAIYSASRGNIRNCLQALYYAMVCGMEADFARIDKPFLVAHHADVTGRVHPEEITL